MLSLWPGQCPILPRSRAHRSPTGQGPSWGSPVGVDRECRLAVVGCEKTGRSQMRPTGVSERKAHAGADACSGSHGRCVREEKARLGVDASKAKVFELKVVLDA